MYLEQDLGSTAYAPTENNLGQFVCSPDGRWVYVVDGASKLYRVEVSSGLTSQLPYNGVGGILALGHRSGGELCIALHFSTDPCHILVLGEAGVVERVDLEGTEGTFPEAAFVPGDDKVILLDEGQAKTFDARSGVLLQSETIVAGGYFYWIPTPGGGLAIRDLGDPASPLHVVIGPALPALPSLVGVEWLNFSPDGKRLLGSQDKVLRLWDLDDTPTEIALSAECQGLGGGGFTPDSSTIIAASSNRFYIMSAKTGARIAPLQNDRHVPLDSARDCYIAGSTAILGDGTSIRTIDLKTNIGSWEDVPRVEAGPIWCSGDGERLCMATRGGHVRSWQRGHGASAVDMMMRSEESLYVFGCGAVTASFSLAAFADGDCTVLQLWDPVRGERIRELKGHTAPIYAIAFSSDEKTVATGAGDGSVRLWDLATGKCKRSLKITDFEASYHFLRFSPTGKYLAACCFVETDYHHDGVDEMALVVWDLASPKQPTVVRSWKCLNAFFLAGESELLGCLAENGTIQQVSRSGGDVAKIQSVQPFWACVANTDASVILVGRANGTATLLTLS